PPTSSSATRSCGRPASGRSWSGSPSASRTSRTSSGTWSRRWATLSARSRRWRRAGMGSATPSSPGPSARPTRGDGMSAVGERNDHGLTAWDRYRILTSYRTIAMVGLSSNYYNPSSFAAIYLDANGYDIVPVNPSQAGEREILGRRVYASLTEAARDHRIEIVDVFRPSHEVPALAREAVAIGA